MSAQRGVVLTTMEGRRSDMPAYPLLPGDVLRQQDDGTWMKVAPGLAIGGFVLSDEDAAELVEETNERWEIVGLAEYGAWCLGGDRV